MALRQQAFTPAKSIDSAQAREFVEQHKEGTYTILDVRQPDEYELMHIPGAKLIPLPQLLDSLHELDPEKPTIVYCASGGRSRVAADVLSSRGFNEVFNLQGGMNGWEGVEAEGPREFHLRFVDGGEMPAHVIALAYYMEANMERFYSLLQERTDDRDLSELFRDLAGREHKHREKIIEMGLQVGLPEMLSQEESRGSIIEGGYEMEEFLETNKTYLASVPGVIELAMMIEAQALDLYLRIAEELSNVAAQDVLQTIADEEKIHLRALGRLLERKLQG